MTMPHMPLASSAAAVVLLAGLSACSDDGDVASPAPPIGASAQPSAGAQGPTPLAAAVVPVDYPNPFVAARAAAAHMPGTARTLAVGLARSDMRAAIESPAAQVRSELTYLLGEHTYLLGMAVDTARRTGSDGPAAEAALAALDENSVAFADTIGRIATDRQREQFLTGWRGLIGALMTYAAAQSDSAEQDAIVALDDQENATGAVLAQITEGSLGPTVARWVLDTHTGRLRAAVEAMKSEAVDAYGTLHAAGRSTAELADALADAFHDVGEVDPDPDGAAAALRAELTHVLVAHVYLTGGAVLSAFAADQGTGAARSDAARGALRANTGEVVAAVRSLVPTAEQPFADAWAAHTENLLQYAAATAADDRAEAARRSRELGGFPAAVGRALDSATDRDLQAAEVQDSMSEHLRHLTGTVDAMAETFGR